MASSRSEQNAFVAFVNSFRLAKRVTSFDQLGDGKALMEIMTSVDPTHFKSVTGRSHGTFSPSGPSENWVLRMNVLKRLYRLLLSFPLPPPRPQNLGLSSLPEPPFSAIARSPESPEGSSGILQICRMCLAVGVWAPGNEKVITKIQGLQESYMSELMRSIEEVMATLPEEEGAIEHRSSPIKLSAEPSSPPLSGIRAERDRLLQDSDELRVRCERLMEQISDVTAKLEEAKEERDDALERLMMAREGSAAPGAGLRTSQTAATAEVDRLKADLLKAEENFAHADAELNKQNSIVADLMKMVEDLKAEAAETSRLKDQVDEYRHAAERLQKSENVIEKYKKKLEDSAGLRRELRNLEEENAALVDTNSKLEGELKRAGMSKALAENYKTQIETLEKRENEQAVHITELTHQLGAARAELSDMEREYERDQEELQLQQERLKEIELGAPGMKRQSSRLSLIAGKATLGDELDVLDENGEAKVDTKTDLRLRIRALQRELAEAKSFSNESHRISALETLLADANKARDRYQAEYLEAHRGSLKLQATLEQIRSSAGKGDNSIAVAALRERLDELTNERDELLKEKQVVEIAKEEIERQLATAKTDLSLVNRDQRDMLASLRQNVQDDTDNLNTRISRLLDQISQLNEKDRLHLGEIKKLLLEKVDLQSSGIDQREKALEREKEFGDLRATLAGKGIPPEAQRQILQLHDINQNLCTELKTTSDKLEKAKGFIRNQDALFRADKSMSRPSATGFEEAQKSYEAQITRLKEELLQSKQSKAALENRYKLENQLMLGAWHDLGARTVRDHMAMSVALSASKRSQPRQQPTSWLGRQRRVQEEASFVR